MATTTRRRKTGARSSARKAKPATKTRYWSKRVMQTSDALDLEEGVFKQRSPRKIAESLKRSAERSKRRKAPAYRSAMSMLTFFMNRAGRNMSAAQRKKLERAKDELRKVFHRET